MAEETEKWSKQVKWLGIAGIRATAMKCCIPYSVTRDVP